MAVILIDDRFGCCILAGKGSTLSRSENAINKLYSLRRPRKGCKGVPYLILKQRVSLGQDCVSPSEPISRLSHRRGLQMKCCRLWNMGRNGRGPKLIWNLISSRQNYSTLFWSNRRQTNAENSYTLVEFRFVKPPGKGRIGLTEIKLSPRPQRGGRCGRVGV